jgi:hypothetical protein
MAEQPPKVSKPFLVIGGIGVLLIVGFLAFKVLGGGGGDSSSSETAASTAATAAPGAPAASTTTTTAPAEPSTPNQSFDVFTTKNPFQPLVTDTASTDTSGGSAVEPPPDTVDPSTGGIVPPPTIPAEQAPSASTAVALLEIFDENGVVFARVQVGTDPVYTVQAGETFAVSYRVVSLDLAAQTGQFQYGDTPFELGVGQQTLK